MKIDAICRVCHVVGQTINADCGHEVHRSCCHATDDKPLGVVVCKFCWHEPTAVLSRRQKVNA